MALGEPDLGGRSADVVRLRAPIAAGLLGKAAEAVTLALLATVVPRLLGPTDYGRFAVALTVVALGSVAMTLGGATVLSRYVPDAEPQRRAGLARALTLRLARNRALAFGVLAVLAAGAVVWDPTGFPSLVTALVLLALALNVAATLALQAGLGLGRTAAWSARYPVQNAVLITAVLVLYPAHRVPGAVVAIPLAALAAAGLGVVASIPLWRAGPAPVALPDGVPRFAVLQAVAGALVQLTQRGGVLVVAWLAGSGPQTGYAGLATGVGLALTYAVAQVFTVTLPAFAAADPGAAERTLRRLTGLALAVTLPVMLGAVASRDGWLPLVFGADYAPAAAAFGPALAMVVLAPLNAVTVQVAALRLRPEVTLRAGVAGVLVFVGVALAGVPVWGAAGATAAALAGTAASAVVGSWMLPGAVGVRLAVGSLAGAALVATMGVLG